MYTESKTLLSHGLLCMPFSCLLWLPMSANHSLAEPQPLSVLCGWAWESMLLAQQYFLNSSTLWLGLGEHAPSSTILSEQLNFVVGLGRACSCSPILSVALWLGLGEHASCSTILSVLCGRACQ